MKLNDTTLIERLAYDLRAVLESLAPSLPIGLAEFPRGACGDTSLLLGTLLVDHGVAGFEYICGDRGSHDDGTWTSHAWLHRDGLVIDITADQFDDGPGPVIVSSDSAWHRGFDWDSPSPSDFRSWHGPGTYDLYRAYGAVKTALMLRAASNP